MMPACAVIFHSAYEPEFKSLNDKVRDRTLAYIRLLAEHGRALHEPHSKPIRGGEQELHELRPQISGRPWRVLYHFLPDGSAILLYGGDKATDEKRWYKTAICVAEQRLAEHAAAI